MIARINKLETLNDFKDPMERLITKWVELEKEFVDVATAFDYIIGTLLRGGYLFIDIDEDRGVAGYVLAETRTGSPGTLFIVQQFHSSKGEASNEFYHELDDILIDEAQTLGMNQIVYISPRAITDYHGTKRFMEKRDYKPYALIFAREVLP